MIYVVVIKVKVIILGQLQHINVLESLLEESILVYSSLF